MTRFGYLERISLRPASPEDNEFLLLLKASTLPELGMLGLDVDQFRSIIRMQLAAQEQGYRRKYPESTHMIVENGGKRAGRFWVNRGENEIRIIDISLLPEFRRNGIGTCLYQSLIAEAETARKKLLCSVSRFNGVSLHFHERLGFTVVSGSDTDLELERTLMGLPNTH
jgi:ribosomal protein S18 acetylase RimI-like enzyme